jgi:hypothetical protein
MTIKKIVEQHHATFESIRQVDEDSQEFWLARSLSKVLDYSEYRHFLPVVERAREACRNSGHPEENHFEDILEMVEIGSGAKRELPDVRLSRYACYLIVQNGDPSKPVIANGQTYFAMQTRRFVSPVRPELVEGHWKRPVIVAEENPLMVRQGSPERSRRAHHERNAPRHERNPKSAHPELVKGLEQSVVYHSWSQT